MGFPMLWSAVADIGMRPSTAFLQSLMAKNEVTDIAKEVLPRRKAGTRVQACCLAKACNHVCFPVT